MSSNFAALDFLNFFGLRCFHTALDFLINYCIIHHTTQA